MTDNGARSSREQVLEELRLADKLIVVTHENPDGDALGSLAAMQGILSALGKDSVPFVDERDLPLPSEYRFLELPGPDHRAPARCRRANRRVPRLRKPRAQSRRGAASRRDAHRQHRPPSRQHPLRHRQPGRPARLLHGRDRVGSDGRPRRRADAHDRRGAVRRPDHRHGPLHVREHHGPRRT